MSNKRPPHIEVFKDRHGKTRVYFRRGKGARVPLPSPIGSPEFETAYAEALAGNVSARNEKRKPASPGTIGALILSYQQSGEYRALRDTTKRNYQTWLKPLIQDHAHRTLSGMTRSGIVTKILAPYADRPGSALNVLRILRVLIRHAIEIEWINHDPTLGIRRPKLGEIRSWTDAEIEQFEKRWPIGTRERLAFALMLFTGQRRSDVRRMTWATTTPATMTVTQQKTGARLIIPIHADLRETLAAAPRDHVSMLTTAAGKTFSIDGFSHFLRDAITAAGLPLECQPHGLRKAAGRRLAEAGCSAKEIMAILGHKSLAEAERYTRDADQETLAEAAIFRLETGRISNKVPKPSLKGLGKISETERKTKR
ncbi:tyrosine-type recombinase/integrase [Methylocystis sp. WRRC1]|uniref:tyrosine-type recombinase/integrase n=1 Tax=Methylocystis sp. WRRC1 TaxID=1732014 RepID=UPI001D13C964|nr:tyrosine-type recombinase/integrase [Methylocystis sp. WRRC1]MCC3245084.1 tyrosine-type recombinase/integrase [Methylocystis sp. WRRC1]